MESLEGYSPYDNEPIKDAGHVLSVDFDPHGRSNRVWIKVGIDSIYHIHPYGPDTIYIPIDMNQEFGMDNPILP